MPKIKQIINYFISMEILLLFSLTARCFVHSLCPLKERGDFIILFLFYVFVRNKSWYF